MIKLFRFLKPYTVLVLIGVLFLFAQAMAELYLPNLMSDIVNKGMMQGDTKYIMQVGVKMLIIALGSSACAIVSSFAAARLGVGFAKDLRNSVFEKVEGYSLHEFESIGTASLITRTTNDITQIQTVFIMGFRFILYSPIMCVGGVMMAMSKNKELSIILAVAIPVLLLVMVAMAGAVVPYFMKMQKKIDRLNLVLRESLTGIRVIRAFNKMSHEKERFHDANKDLTDTAIRVNKIMAAMQPIMMLVFNGTTIAIIWFGGLSIAKNQIEIGDMMAFMQYTMQILFSVIMVAVMFVMIPRAQASAVRINEIFDIKTEIKEPSTGAESENKQASVQFKNVTFSYPGSDESVLKNISFESKKGQITAIIGGTGSGKSTLINLIPRFYDATEGEILVDGMNVKDMKQSYLKSKIGFVPQGAILFSGTINENIKFGKKDATAEEIEKAARVAQAYDFISKMPDAFESPISQGGTNVSGGQKQRISIARAIVRRPEVYIFDDSLSALDFKTDALLRAALKQEIADATVLIVAQRITSVVDADQIIVLDEGEMVGIGTHDYLLENCEVYREIVSSQLSEEEIK